MNFEAAQKANGTVNNNGTEIALTQVAYAENYGSGVRYYAAGINLKGNTYLVAWDTTEEWDSANDRINAARINGEDTDPLDESLMQDESNACNWESPAEVKLIEEAE